MKYSNSTWYWFHKWLKDFWGNVLQCFLDNCPQLPDICCCKILCSNRHLHHISSMCDWDHVRQTWWLHYSSKVSWMLFTSVHGNVNLMTWCIILLLLENIEWCQWIDQMDTKDIGFKVTSGVNTSPYPYKTITNLHSTLLTTGVNSLIVSVPHPNLTINLKQLERWLIRPCHTLPVTAGSN